MKYRDIVHQSVETKNLSSGDTLVKVGPRQWFSYYGSGQCGGCSRFEFVIYYIEADTGDITPIFERYGIIDRDENEIDVEISSEWDKITVFKGKDMGLGGEWSSSETFCLRDGQYVTCE